MKTYFVYIILCSDNSYYTGVTNNLEKRIIEHNEGLDKKAYTYSRRPVKLVWYTSTNDVNYAISSEKQIKGWRRAKKEALINRNYKALTELSLAYRDSQS